MAQFLCEIAIINVQVISNLNQQSNNTGKEPNTVTLYHFGTSVGVHVSILLQLIILISVIILRIDEAELDLLFSWGNLWKIMIYGFLILVFLDNALFRGLFRLLMSVGYGVVGYIYSSDYVMPLFSYTIGVLAFIVLMGINFYGVKNLYDI